MSNYKLVTFDMDGTLLDSNKKIRQDSLEAIHKALAAGKYVSLSTGRPIPEIGPYEEQLKDVPFYICSSGATIVDRRANKLIFAQTLAEETVWKIFNLAKDYDVMYHMLSTDAYMEQGHFDHIENYHMEMYRPLYAAHAKKVKNIKEFYQEQQYPVYKFNLYLRHPEQRLELREKLLQLGITVALAETASLECSPLDISKGTALEKLCQYLSISTAEAIAVGDSDNDLEILQTAGLGAAMGNANERVKAIADVIVKDCDNGGCAQVIEEYLLQA